MSLLTIYYILLISLNVGAQVVKPKSFNIRKDLTEHCRRGVALSVFLGTHVTEASSQVLQFGKAVIPYSCYIAARTEAGNNIILVMQDMQDDQLQRACKDYAKQIIVYEIHDTYGGYWGEMPDFVRHPEPLPSNVYTLQTVPTPTETAVDEYYEDSSEVIETTTTTDDLVRSTSEAPTRPNPDTIAFEIPIVNISGRFMDPYKSLKDIFGIRSTLKQSAHSPNQYQTTMYPIVQFSEESGLQPYFAFDYNINPFDESMKRLTSTKSSHPQHFWDLFKKTTRLKFAKFQTQDDDSFFESNPTETQKNQALKLDLENIFPSNSSINNPKGLMLVTSTPLTSNKKTASNKIRLHNTIEEYPYDEHDLPEYQYSTFSSGPEDSDLSDVDVENPDRRSENEFERYTEKQMQEVKPSTIDPTTPSIMVIDIPKHNINISKSNKSATPSVNLANRETWENLVLAAPKMASVLNMSSMEETLLDLDPNLEGVTLLDKAKRDKRYLQGISVKNMVPRPVTSESFDTSKSEGVNYLEMNLAEFGKNVERINEEAQSRVALRYPHRFLGKELFNLCDHKDLQTRHIFMFNSSRIWIEVSNFSMESISIVLTEARRVLDTDSFCDAEYLECQLSGSRVCIDALNACDGVPNCGAYDIYDEDRLKCGYTPGMQQSVCIAAFAFLVLAHTVIYIIMYWLKRCVPKVSTAFFIYSEGAENMLNLHSVMKSPYFENTSISDTSISDQNFEEILPSVQSKKASVYQILRDSFRQLLGGRTHRVSENKRKEERRSERASIFTPEFYTAKYFEDTSVQTTINMNTFKDTKVGEDADELKILKFCKEAKCGCTNDSNEIQFEREPRLSSESQESKVIPLRSSFAKRNSIKLNIDRLDKLHHQPYNPLNIRTIEAINKQEAKQSFDSTESKDSLVITTTADVHPQSDKKLRFDEVAITIKNSVDEGLKRFSTEKLGMNLDKIEVEAEPGTSKQSKYFWLGKKKKKPATPASSPWPRPRSNK